MIDQKLTTDAVSAILGDRNRTHGNPADTLTRIAKLWSIYLETDITGADVAKLMTLVKIARSRGRYDRDHYLDGIGYLLLAEALDR